MPEDGRRTLVTGALGCVGAWTLKALLDLGEDPVGYDLGGDDARLRLVLADDERSRVTLVEGDVTDPDALGRTLDEHGITNVVHLAAMQVPFVRADPQRGARVNVLGTVVVFEAVKARLNRIRGVAYASSTAVYNPADRSPAPEAGGTEPSTLYGVFKHANEGTARVYWHEDDVASIGIRPYVVYGPGRDQGLTSGPSLAMAAAARGEGFTIGYGGTAQYDFAPDVGRAFALASRATAVKRTRSPCLASFIAGVMSTEATGVATTRTRRVPVTSVPLVSFAVMMASPAPTAVSWPSLRTVATRGALEV